MAKTFHHGPRTFTDLKVTSPQGRTKNLVYLKTKNCWMRRGVKMDGSPEKSSKFIRLKEIVCDSDFHFSSRGKVRSNSSELSPARRCFSRFRKEMAGTGETREYLEIRGHLSTRGTTSRKATLPIGGLKDGKWRPLSEDIP